VDADGPDGIQPVRHEKLEIAEEEEEFGDGADCGLDLRL